MEQNPQANTSQSVHAQASLQKFYENYKEAAQKSGASEDDLLALFQTFCKRVEHHIQTPYQFPPYHKAIREPFDYYALGLEFIRPLIDFTHSTLTGQKNLEKINQAIENKENVILLANHQTEIDPQVISLFLEKKSPQLASEMIFMAGHRVVQDPLATPMSLGRNLLCIYSKKYIDQPAEKKAEKLLHNRRTLKIMEELLHEGGKCIYVAPSGGRDRMDEKGCLQPALFDADSIEMLYLISKKSGTPTHFHALSLYTYPLLPPPKEVHVGLGEVRSTTFAPVHLAFGAEFEMEKLAADVSEKQERKKRRAELIWQEVAAAYDKFPVH